MKLQEGLLARVRVLWETLANAPGGFGEAHPIKVVTSPESRLCPPSWVGIVRIEEAVLVTARDEGQAEHLRTAFQSIAAESLVNEELLKQRLPIEEMLGPATVAYLAPEEFQPQQRPAVDELTSKDPAVIGCGSRCCPARSRKAASRRLARRLSSFDVATKQWPSQAIGRGSVWRHTCRCSQERTCAARAWLVPPPPPR